MPPSNKRHEIHVSSEAFDEITGALAAQNIKLEKNDEYTIKSDTAIKGPINYRQVNLRHELLKELIHVYEPPMSEVGDRCMSDPNHFINWFDPIYKYILTGDVPNKPNNVVELSIPKKPEPKWD